MPITMKNWQARRSGAAMSIVGQAAGSGERIKLTDIVAIVPRPDKLACVEATARDGTAHLLLI